MSEGLGLAALVAALAVVYLLGKARQRALNRDRDDRYKREVKADQDDISGISAREWRERLRKRASRHK